MTQTQHPLPDPYLFIIPPHEPDDDTTTPVDDPRKPKSPVEVPPEEEDDLPIDDEMEDPSLSRPALEDEPPPARGPESEPT